MTTTPRTRSFLALAAVPALVAALAGCSSGGTGDTSSGTPEEQARSWDLALTECVRDAGFEMDDPSSGGISISVGEGVDPDAQFAAIQDCQQQVTGERGERPVTEQEKAQGEESSKEYEKVLDCLEEHGVEVPEQSGSGLSKAPEVPDAVAEACGSPAGFAPTGAR